MKQPTAHAALIRACASAIILGCAIQAASAQDIERYTIAGAFVPPAAAAGDDRAFTDAIVWEVPISEVAALFGLTPGGYDWSAPGLTVDVWSAPGERARVEAFAMAWMVVYRQPAIPYFRTPEAGTPAMRLRYEPNRAPAHPQRWSPEIESRLLALRARYDQAVSRWLARRAKAATHQSL
jgi:hypothetical protein